MSKLAVYFAAYLLPRTYEISHWYIETDYLYIKLIDKTNIIIPMKNVERVEITNG